MRRKVVGFMSVKVKLASRLFAAIAASLFAVSVAALLATWNAGPALAEEPSAQDDGSGLVVGTVDDSADDADSQEMSDQATNMVAGTSLVSYYKPILQRCNKYCKYTLFDLDGNGVPELLTLDESLPNSKAHANVYTVTNNGVNYCGTTSASGIPAFGMCAGNDGMYLSWAHMSVGYYVKITLVNGSVKCTTSVNTTDQAKINKFAKDHGIYGLETASTTNYSLLNRYGVVSKSPGQQVVWRLYNPNSGEHFYTTSENERGSLAAAGWTFERFGWVATTNTGTPVYRLYNPNAGDHHYTTSINERKKLEKAGWKYENICWYSASTSGVKVYREYNPNQYKCNHNYTTSKKEHDGLIAKGWKDEGVAWYGL